MNLEDFDFQLPKELIAQKPCKYRSSSLLLQVTQKTLAENSLEDSSISLSDSIFHELPSHLNPGDLLVFNDTKVIKARLLGFKLKDDFAFNAIKNLGAKIEVLIERIINSTTALCQIRGSKIIKLGQKLVLINENQNDKTCTVIVGERLQSFFKIYFPLDAFEIIENYGHIPLPPYITRSSDKIDECRYQTVYAKSFGAIAAPTAGLHFDKSLIKILEKTGIQISYLTLHVGAGTFTPIRDLVTHKMHSERCILPNNLAQKIIDTKRSGNKVIAIGTTSLRALEAAAMLCGSNNLGELKTMDFETDIFIRPGFKFKVVDALITNFHLPKSTLFILISAFIGIKFAHEIYSYAIYKKYKFFSYGDAMFLPCLSK